MTSLIFSSYIYKIDVLNSSIMLVYLSDVKLHFSSKPLYRMLPLIPAELFSKMRGFVLKSGDFFFSEHVKEAFTSEWHIYCRERNWPGPGISNAYIAPPNSIAWFSWNLTCAV